MLSKMELWGGYHMDDRNVPITINVEFDEDLNIYVIEVKRGYDIFTEEFEPSNEPIDGLMHISDVETSVKIADNLIKKLMRTAKRKRK